FTALLHRPFKIGKSSYDIRKIIDSIRESGGGEDEEDAGVGAHLDTVHSAHTTRISDASE
ncbi:hypothetical protein OC844_007760, partial [Tilletia horrida]